MRVRADTQLLDLAPGGAGEVCLEVDNTSQVIDGVSARVIGLPSGQVVTTPSVLPLFPDTTGTMRLKLAVPPTFPAGTHPVTVELTSRAEAHEPALVDLDLVVARAPQLALRAHPASARGRRRARYRMEVLNRGNVDLDVDLSLSEDTGKLQGSFTPAQLAVPPGQVATSLLAVRAPRLLFGSPLNRPLQVIGDAGATQASVPLVFQQLPRVSRGLLVAGILVAIVALWALAFLLGLAKIAGSDPLTKTAPPSFFVSSAAATSALGPGVAPGSMLPKSGILPPGVGGVVTGQVSAVSDGSGVGRVVVEALRSTPTGGLSLVSSAATQSDGTFTLSGLFPGQYYLRFSALGYRTVWYPNSATASGARQLTVSSGVATQGANAKIAGLPASITGSVDPGDVTSHVATTVVARPIEGAQAGAAVARAVTSANNTFALGPLPAPDTYQLSYSAAGYQTTTVIDRVAGGQQRIDPTVLLSAGSGSIGGIVSDNGAGLGGVVVTTTVAGQTFSSGSPTMGAVGRYLLTGLPTPDTYVLTFTKQGYGTRTEVVDLGPGETNANVSVSMVGGTGSVSGQVVDSSGAGLGGAQVSVGGTPTPVSTTSLTTGSVGLFAISGLPAPGSYTITVSLAGYSPATVPITLSNAVAPSVTITLTQSVGQISGQVLLPTGSPAVGASVTVTNGAQKWTATTVDASGSTPAGSYLVSGLAPGSYSVTATMSGYGQQTGIVHLAAGGTPSMDLTLQAQG